jgi:NLR family CARD domain-containing protein 3
VWCLSCHSLADNALVSQTGYIKASKVEGASKEAGAKVMYQGREMVVSKGINRDGEMKMWDFSGIAALAEGLKQNCSLTSIK